MVAVVLFATLLESIDTKDFIVVSFRPIVFVRNGREGINRFGSLSGEISQHQRKGLDDTYQGSSLELLFLPCSKYSLTVMT